MPHTDFSGAERWQILSPVRAEAHGVDDLNRWVQGTWRGVQLDSDRKYRRTFGLQEVVRLDKLILLRNGERDGYDNVAGVNVKDVYLANGEVGLASGGKSWVMNVAFAGREPTTFGFRSWEFGGEDAQPRLELAYALTVHKAQGSEFRVVIVGLPRGTRLGFRELVYTALTRSNGADVDGSYQPAGYIEPSLYSLTGSRARRSRCLLRRLPPTTAR